MAPQNWGGGGLLPHLAAFVAAIDDSCPVALPFFAPGKRLSADWADFGREIMRVTKRFLFRHGLIFRLANRRQ